jgi:hypothetical protein
VQNFSLKPPSSCVPLSCGCGVSRASLAPSNPPTCCVSREYSAGGGGGGGFGGVLVRGARRAKRGSVAIVVRRPFRRRGAGVVEQLPESARRQPTTPQQGDAGVVRTLRIRCCVVIPEGDRTAPIRWSSLNRQRVDGMWTHTCRLCGAGADEQRGFEPHPVTCSATSHRP